MAGKRKSKVRKTQSIENDVLDSDEEFESQCEEKGIVKPLSVDWERTHNHRIPLTKKVFGTITYADVEQAIWRSEGLLTNVARALKINVYQVKQIMAKYKLLKQDFEEYREAVIDEAETCLRNQMRKGNTAATIFLLKCLGKGRGYIESDNTKGAKGSVKMKIVPATDANVKKALKSAKIDSPAANSEDESLEGKKMGKVLMMPKKAEGDNG